MFARGLGDHLFCTVYSLLNSACDSVLGQTNRPAKNAGQMSSKKRWANAGIQQTALDKNAGGLSIDGVTWQ
jgi:hypothetical protein